MIFKSVLVITFYALLSLIDQFSSTCYNRNGKVQFCQPSFINIAKTGRVTVTSTCNENICKKLSPESNSIFFGCSKCNHSYENSFQNGSLLIDLQTKGRENCLMAEKISTMKSDHVINITVDLSTLYEAYYVTIEFCGDVPDSVILYKSIDRGLTYSPWHYFSSNCQKSFKMKRHSASRMQRQSFMSLDPVCFVLSKNLQTIGNGLFILPFNPTVGRSISNIDSILVKNWISLTTLKVSLISDSKKRVSLEKTKYIAISDIAIGGRGQCYGHADYLSTETNNTSFCKCEHNTGGLNCEKCLDSHNDQPWRPFINVPSKDRACEKCYCNRHSEKCQFDAILYKRTGGKHGSSCIDCQHHTTGPHCKQCASGYYRNQALPVDHIKVCQKCKCHLIGSKNVTDCDARTGQCHCKEGVEGQTCNRCRKGYLQTRSSTNPCAPDMQKNMMATEERCSSCGKNKPRIKFKKFCKKHLMIKISIQSKEIHGEWTRFGVRIMKIWRIQPSVQSQISIHESDYIIHPIWVENSDIRCSCPSFELGHAYLLLTKGKQKLYHQQPELVVDRKSIVLKWRDNWVRRLESFKERESQGKCDRFRYRRKYSRWRLYSHKQYMNDN